MRSTSCPHIDFLGTLNKQLATQTEPSGARLKELNDILLALHSLLPHTSGDGSDYPDEDEQIKYSSVPGLVQPQNGSRLELLDHHLLSIGYTLLAVKIELRSLAAHLPDYQQIIVKLERQVQKLEDARSQRLQSLSSAHYDTGKITNPAIVRHFSPKKAICSQLIGSVEEIDELPGDSPATVTMSTTAPEISSHLQEEDDYHNGEACHPSYKPNPVHTTQPGHHLMPGSRSIDGTSTGDSSIWQVTPVHHRSRGHNYGQPHSRTRSDDFLTDSSDVSDFPSAGHSLRRANGGILPTAHHTSSMNSISRNSTSHWSLKSNPLGTSPCPASLLMNSQGSNGLHTSMDSLLSPKVSNGAFEQPPPRRLSIVGRRSVSKFSVSNSDVSLPYANDRDNVFLASTPSSPALINALRLSRTLESSELGSRTATPDRGLPVFSPTTPTLPNSTDKDGGVRQGTPMSRSVASLATRQLPSLESLQSGRKVEDAKQPVNCGDKDHEERLRRVNQMLKEKFGDGVRLSVRKTAARSSAGNMTAVRPRSGRRNRGNNVNHPPVIGSDGTVRVALGRRSSSCRLPSSPRQLFKTKPDLRLDALDDLIDTEAEYVERLQKLESIYAGPMSSLRVITCQEKRVLFPGELQSIQSRHEEFLASLHQCRESWSSHASLEKTFNSLSGKNTVTPSLLDMYEGYLQKFPKAIQFLGQKLRVSECVRSFVKDCQQTPGCDPLDSDVASLLVAPVKRLPQYIRHIKVLLKHTDDHTDKAALLQMVQMLNGKLHAMEDLFQLSADTVKKIVPEQSLGVDQARDSIRQSLHYSSITRAKPAQKKSNLRRSMRSRFSERPIDVDGLDTSCRGQNSLAARRRVKPNENQVRYNRHEPDDGRKGRRKPSRKLSLKFMVNVWQQRHQSGNESQAMATQSDTSPRRTRAGRRKTKAKGIKRAKTFSTGGHKQPVVRKTSKARSLESSNGSSSSSQTDSAKSAFLTGSTFTLPGRYDKQSSRKSSSGKDSPPHKKVVCRTSSTPPPAKIKKKKFGKGDHRSQAHEQSKKLAASLRGINLSSSELSVDAAVDSTSLRESYIPLETTVVPPLIPTTMKKPHPTTIETTTINTGGEKAMVSKSSVVKAMTTEIADDCGLMVDAIMSEFGQEVDDPMWVDSPAYQPSPSPLRTRPPVSRRTQNSLGSPARRSPIRSPGHAQRKIPHIKPNVPQCASPLVGTPEKLMESGAAMSPYRVTSNHSTLSRTVSISQQATSLPRSPLQKKNSVSSFGSPRPDSLTSHPMATSLHPILTPSSSLSRPVLENFLSPSPLKQYNDSVREADKNRQSPTPPTGRNDKGMVNHSKRSAKSAIISRHPLTGKEEKMGLFSLPANHTFQEKHALNNGLANVLAQPGFSYVPSASGKNIFIVKAPKKPKRSGLVRLKFWKNRSGTETREKQNNTPAPVMTNKAERYEEEICA